MARKFPDSAAQWALDYPTIPVPSNLWVFQEAASPILDKIGSSHFVENQALAYQQAGDPTGRLAVAMDTSVTAEWAGAGATPTVGNIVAGTPWSFYVRFRMPTTVAARGIVGKAITQPRWVLTVEANKDLRWLIGDGVSTFTPRINQVYDGNVYHDALMVYDPANAVFRLITELHTAPTVATGSYAGTTGATELRVFSQGAAGLAGTQISYAAFWPGTAITASQLATILASDEPGQFDVSGVGENSFAGVTGISGAYETLGEGSISAGPGAVELQGSYNSDSESFQTFNGMSILEGIVDVGGTGDISASGDSASFAALDLLASGDLSLLGQLGLLGSFSVDGLGTFDESSDLGFFFVESAGGSLILTDDVYFPITGGRLNQAIKKHKTGDYNVRRAPYGSFDDRGRYLENIRGVFRIEASVQPVTGKDMQVLVDGQGRHTTEQKVIYCTKALHPQSDSLDADIIELPDLEGNLTDFEVTRCTRWDHWGDVHYIAYASRLKIP